MKREAQDQERKTTLLKLGFATEKLLESVVDPSKMVYPYVAGKQEGLRPFSGTLIELEKR
jgi:hypothetical protein